MTRTAARQTLDTREAAITANVEDYYAGRITHEEFTRRQYAHHDAIRDAGQTDHFCRRWRAATA
jgi:hypothetical protein